MILICLILLGALVCLVFAAMTFRGLPDSKSAVGKRVMALTLAAGLLVLAGAGMGLAIIVQERTGIDAGLRGGVSSDARTWMRRHENAPPNRDEVGNNMRILREGMVFLKSHDEGLTPQDRALLIQYSVLPERPQSLLSREEELQYFDGASGVYGIISRLADEGAGGE